MRKLAVLTMIAVLALSVATECSAQQNWKLGVHSAYSAGGDVEESEFGFGGQIEAGISDNFSIELSASSFSEGEEEDIGLDLITIGLSGIFKSRMSSGMTLYLLAGLNYNIIDTELTDVWDDYSEVEDEDKIGYHIGGGFDFPINDNTGLFLEYRYTLLELEAEVRGNRWHRGSDEVTGDYNFGLIKAGVNISF